ncbi:MAG: hypothetical protein LBT24_06415 [Tannerella sp.]|jgi:hypothetical protein|nr:hypothetical protein [Tannerella sp.]
MKNIVRHITIIIIVLPAILQSFGTFAQSAIVDLKLDSADILIGEQTVLKLSVTTNKDKQVLIPLPASGQNLMQGVEVLMVTPPDTVDIDNNRMTINYNLVITSFDSALYLLPMFPVIDGTDTLFSNRVALKVISPDVDVENPEEYFDIKNIWKPPFVLSDYYALIYGALFTLFIICVIGYFLQKMRNRKPKDIETKPVSKIPPHEQAIKELKEIREQKLWQQGRNKEYYTEVTDTLRRYITSRYGTSVMEKTTFEILEVIRDEEPGNKEVLGTLKQILQLSDFVKFAKLHPLPDENDLSMMNAQLFIEKTKRIEPIVPIQTVESIESEMIKPNETTLNN